MRIAIIRGGLVEQLLTIDDPAILDDPAFGPFLEGATTADVTSLVTGIGWSVQPDGSHRSPPPGSDWTWSNGTWLPPAKPNEDAVWDGQTWAEDGTAPAQPDPAPIDGTGTPQEES